MQKQPFVWAIVTLILALFNACASQAEDDADDDSGGDADGDSDSGSGDPCQTDDQCTAGSQWCSNGRCVPCDNDGEICDLGCRPGWELYRRNGCLACACAPVNECVRDSDCEGSAGQTMKCYAGAFCWDWCPEDDPSCCYGNLCSEAGCEGMPPVGCWTIGCPLGSECEDSGCEPSETSCQGGDWITSDDCGGGSCQ